MANPDDGVGSGSGVYRLEHHALIRDGRERACAAVGMRDRIGMGIGGVARVPSYRGRGPKGYVRSDERVRELVCEALTDDELVDATEIEVVVQAGQVTLSGVVADERMKQGAEDCVGALAGIRDVRNWLEVRS